ncbi:ATP-binding protein [Paraburkholderia caribensis]|uniref:ATP-binding protein n=1 Tax=Paraburkholderia caribensis TaxID=75105 RepID=UPI0034D2F1AD
MYRKVPSTMIPPSRNRVIVFGPFRLSPAERTLYAGTERVEIGNRAFDILLTLVSHPDQVITHDMFSAIIWPDTVVENVNLRVHIARLRRTLATFADDFRCIESVPGRGYRYVGKVLYEENFLGALDAKPVEDHPRVGDEDDYGTLIGRWPDLRSIERLLTQARVVTIVGPGGVGKTSLALAAMRAYCSTHSVNAVCVELSSVISAGLVASALASALDITVVGNSPLDAVVASLRRTRMLLLIDSCEHVIGGVTRAVEAIHRAADGVTILATSREPLRAHDEWVYRLQPLQFPDPGQALVSEDALQFPSVRLFVERAKSMTRDFILTSDNVNEVGAICRALDGLPLSIELAAARLEIFGTKELLAGIDKRLSLLTRGRRTALPRHQTLRSTIDWSYTTLSDSEKMALRHISIFKGTFTLAQALAVIGEHSDVYSDVLPLLTELVDKSLLVATPDEGSSSFRMLDSTREYCLEKLTEVGEFDEVARAHTVFLCTLFTEPVVFRPPTESLDPLTCNRRILDDVRAALDWSFSERGEPALGITLTWASAPLFYQLSLFDEYRERVDLALKFVHRANYVNVDAQYRLQLALAQADFLTQGLQRGVAPRAFYSALALAETAGDRARQYRALYGTIVMTVMAGDYDDAGQLTGRMLELAKTRPAELPLYHRLEALVETQKGLLESALNHARHSLSLEAGAPDSTHNHDATRYAHRPTVLSLEARTLWLMGYADDAVEVAAESIEAATELGNRLSLCCALASGACPVACWRGDINDLKRFLDRLEPLSNEMSLINWRGQAHCYTYALPGVEIGTGPHFWSRFDNLPASSHEILATVNGRLVTPLALDRAKTGKAGYATAEIFRALGENLLASGTALCSESEALFRSAIAIAKGQGARSWQLRATTSLAKLRHRLGSVQESEDLLCAALELMTQGHASIDYKNAKALLEGIRQF